jgi:hypothetical protein
MKLAKERGHGKHKLKKHEFQSANQQSPIGLVERIPRDW